VDACVSPQGDLVVGLPHGRRIGGGPAAKAGCSKFATRARFAAAGDRLGVGADEFRIAFDRPIDSSPWLNAREKRG